MAESKAFRPNDCTCFKEAVCIDAERIYDSCSDKDCLEDLHVFFSDKTQPIIDKAASIKCKKVKVINVCVDVESVPFNKGSNSVDMNLLLPGGIVRVLISWNTSSQLLRYFLLLQESNPVWKRSKCQSLFFPFRLLQQQRADDRNAKCSGTDCRSNLSCLPLCGVSGKDLLSRLGDPMPNLHTGWWKFPGCSGKQRGLYYTRSVYHRSAAA